MSITLTIAGVAYSYPSGAADTNWAAQQVAAMQALVAVANAAPRVLETNVTPAGSGADTTEDNLMTYTLPAGTLSANGQGIRVTAMGAGVSTVDVTTLRCYFGASAGALVVSKVLQASQINVWRATFEVFRTGAATQVAFGTIFNGGTASTTVTGGNEPTSTLSSALTIKLTGQRASSSVANSVIQTAWAIEFIPAA